MAFKKYGYYIKGNKIALIEQSDATSSGSKAVAHCSGVSGSYTTKDTCEAAGGQWIPGSSGSTSNYSEYMSPTESVADGLEIQYAYSPRYSVSSNTTVDVNKFYVNGWTVIGGYLTFLRARAAGAVNWTSTPESAVTSGSSGDTGGQSLDYIVVGGSSRWNGLHKVQTAGTEGQLITYTKVNETIAYFEDQDIDFNTDQEIYDGGGSSNIYLADHFSAGDYVWISGVTGEADTNEGLFKVASVSQSSTDTSSKITVDTRYVVVDSSSATTSSTGLGTEYSVAAAFDAKSALSVVNIYKAYRDFAYVLTDVNTLNDEGDTIDLPDYQANAVVYYLKAKMAEDAGDFDRQAYFMREFKRQLEKSTSALKRGPYMVQGFKEMR